MTTPAKAYQEHQREMADPEALLERYFPLVRFHAEQLARRLPQEVELEDLVQAGVVGLLDAAQRFDPSRGVQFSTFASYRIRGAIVDHLRALDWAPRSARHVLKDVGEVMQAIEQTFGRPAEEEEIAAHLGLSVEEYRKRLEQARAISVISFEDLPVQGENDEDPLPLIEAISADHRHDPEHCAGMIEFVHRLAKAIAELPPRERILLTLYYYEELSMKEVALVLGVTESRVSQLHTQMVVRLRSKLRLDE